MMHQYDGLEVVDVEGEKLGKVEKTYVNDADVPQFIEVNLGGLRAKKRLIPVEGAHVQNKVLRVDHAKDFIADSPDSDWSETLHGDPLDEVRGYYAGGQVAPTPVESSGDAHGTSFGDRVREAKDNLSQRFSGSRGESVRQVPTERVRESNVTEVPTEQVEQGAVSGAGSMEARDLGDVIEVPIVEEELVKRPVVKEVLRIRKSSSTERETIGADVRREDVEVETDKGVPMADEADREKH